MKATKDLFNEVGEQTVPTSGAAGVQTRKSLRNVLATALCAALFTLMALGMAGCGNDAASTATTTDDTDEKTVGAALQKLGLIAGDDSEYGLYVKTVNGVTVDYDKDGKYWAFYIDGEYAQTGVDSTDVTAGSTYTFKVE